MELNSEVKRKHSMNVNAKQRRLGVISRLEKQLLERTKPARTVDNCTDESVQVPLEERDINRIKKELSILKTRI